ncbi:MAG: hypothetical protein R3330_11795 [Saprospiraceae bacterium]|nr:hypothetical protein [Saprospiraceae bacterium]
MTLIICALAMCVEATAQHAIAFDFAAEDPSAVSHIFINLSFNKPDGIPADIDRFTNLRELTFFPQYDWFPEEMRPLPPEGEAVMCYEEVRIDTIPATIGACDQLEVLRIPEGRIEELPATMTNLKALRILQLPGCINLDPAMSVLLAPDQLELLHCFGCILSDTHRETLEQQHPGIRFIITESDLYRAVDELPKFHLHVEGEGSIVFYRQVDAEMFHASMPDQMVKQYQVWLPRY